MFKVFPGTITIDGQKKPLIKGWKDAASNDPEQIRAWQNTFGNKITYWAVPTGTLNGILVLDVDFKTGGYQTLLDKNLFIPDTLSQRTINGGTHFIFKYNPSRDPGNRVGILPGLDIRSEGGHIFWYGKDVDWSKPIADMPAWITEVTKSHPKAQAEEVKQCGIKLLPEVVNGILIEALNTIRNAPSGESNDTLNRESFKVGQLVACGSITREVAENELFKAAKDRGKPDREARATIESGINGGLKTPLLAPFGPPTVNALQIPEVPKPPPPWTPRKMTREDLLNTSKLRKPQIFKDWSTEDIHLVTADGGTGKTTLMLYEAVCLALGDRFLGFDCLAPGKTLYITGEDTEAKLAAMVGAIIKQIGIIDDEAKVQTILDSIVIKKDSDLCLITKDKLGFLHPNLEACDKILHAVTELKPKMIIFDPISSFWGSESALNDMSKAVTKFMSRLVEVSDACVVMINHMGKVSSNAKDLTQFAGRGGTGLPSHSRVVRGLRPVPSDEYFEMTGTELNETNTAMLCNVDKFTDGSPLYRKPFIILRYGYLFSRIELTPTKLKEIENKASDTERIFAFVKQERSKDKYPTSAVIIGHFMNCSEPLSQDRIKRAITGLCYSGYMGEKFKLVDNPDLTVKEKAVIITDLEGKEN